MALVTRDPALYADLASALRERRTPTISLLPGQRIPARAAVVLTSPSEAPSIHHPNVLAVPQEGDRTALWAAVESALGDADTGEELVVGIDPGPRPGYAVVSGDASLSQGVLDSPEAAGRLGARLHLRFSERRIRFRVGSGDPIARNRTVNALLPLDDPVEIVDEQGTTPRGHRRPRDAAAARAIAHTPGRRIRSRTPVTTTPGEIANLQRLSREGSGGQFTLPREEADRVLRGELTMKEALDRRAEEHAAHSRLRRRGPRPREPS